MSGRSGWSELSDHLIAWNGSAVWAVWIVWIVWSSDHLTAWDGWAVWAVWIVWSSDHLICLSCLISDAHNLKDLVHLIWLTCLNCLIPDTSDTSRHFQTSQTFKWLKKWVCWCITDLLQENFAKIVKEMVCYVKSSMKEKSTVVSTLHWRHFIIFSQKTLK